MDTLLRETVNAVVNSRFPEMSIEGRRQIESILIREEFPKGAIALNEGEVAHELVFVGKGMLRQYYYKNGKDVTEHFSYEGCIVMCIESFLKQVPTRLIVETLEPSIIYLFPRDMIQKLARENWEINMFYQKIGSDVCQRRAFDDFRMCFEQEVITFASGFETPGVCLNLPLFTYSPAT